MVIAVEGKSSSWNFYFQIHIFIIVYIRNLVFVFKTSFLI
jgi:hypothetical protein